MQRMAATLPLASPDPALWNEAEEALDAALDRFRTYLQHRGLWSEAQEVAFKESIAQRVNDAIAAAEQNGPPADESLVTDVYAQVPQQLKDQLAEVLALEGRAVNQGAFPL